MIWNKKTLMYKLVYALITKTAEGKDVLSLNRKRLSDENTQLRSSYQELRKEHTELSMKQPVMNAKLKQNEDKIASLELQLKEKAAVISSLEERVSRQKFYIENTLGKVWYDGGLADKLLSDYNSPFTALCKNLNKLITWSNHQVHPFNTELIRSKLDLRTETLLDLRTETLLDSFTTSCRHKVPVSREEQEKRLKEKVVADLASMLLSSNMVERRINM